MTLHASRCVPALTVCSVTYTSPLFFLACVCLGFFYLILVMLSLIQMGLELSPEASYSRGTHLCAIGLKKGLPYLRVKSPAFLPG